MYKVLKHRIFTQKGAVAIFSVIYCFWYSLCLLEFLFMGLPGGEKGCFNVWETDRSGLKNSFILGACATFDYTVVNKCILRPKTEKDKWLGGPIPERVYLQECSSVITLDVRLEKRQEEVLVLSVDDMQDPVAGKTLLSSSPESSTITITVNTNNAFMLYELSYLQTLFYEKFETCKTYGKSHVDKYFTNECYGSTAEADCWDSIPTANKRGVCPTHKNTPAVSTSKLHLLDPKQGTCCSCKSPHYGSTFSRGTLACQSPYANNRLKDLRYHDYMNRFCLFGVDPLFAAYSISSPPFLEIGLSVHLLLPNPKYMEQEFISGDATLANSPALAEHCTSLQISAGDCMSLIQKQQTIYLSLENPSFTSEEYGINMRVAQVDTLSDKGMPDLSDHLYVYPLMNSEAAILDVDPAAIKYSGNTVRELEGKGDPEGSVAWLVNYDFGCPGRAYFLSRREVGPGGHICGAIGMDGRGWEDSPIFCITDPSVCVRGNMKDKINRGENIYNIFDMSEEESNEYYHMVPYINGYPSLLYGDGYPETDKYYDMLLYGDPEQARTFYLNLEKTAPHELRPFHDKGICSAPYSSGIAPRDFLMYSYAGSVTIHLNISIVVPTVNWFEYSSSLQITKVDHTSFDQVLGNCDGAYIDYCFLDVFVKNLGIVQDLAIISISDLQLDLGSTKLPDQYNKFSNSFQEYQKEIGPQETIKFVIPLVPINSVNSTYDVYVQVQGYQRQPLDTYKAEIFVLEERVTTTSTSTTKTTTATTTKTTTATTTKTATTTTTARTIGLPEDATAATPNEKPFHDPWGGKYAKYTYDQKEIVDPPECSCEGFFCALTDKACASSAWSSLLEILGILGITAVMIFATPCLRDKLCCRKRRRKRYR